MENIPFSCRSVRLYLLRPPLVGTATTLHSLEREHVVDSDELVTFHSATSDPLILETSRGVGHHLIGF